MQTRSWNFVDDGQVVGFHRGSVPGRPRWTVALWSTFAFFIDLLLLAGATCAVFLVLLKLGPAHGAISLRAFFHVFGLEFALTTLALFVSYLVSTRMVAGCTVGEWASGLRLGEPRHRLSRDYTLKVAQRMLILLVTGLVVLPVLSLLTGIDWAGRICGLPLVQHRG